MSMLCLEVLSSLSTCKYAGLDVTASFYFKSPCTFHDNLAVFSSTFAYYIVYSTTAVMCIFTNFHHIMKLMEKFESVRLEREAVRQ